MMDPEQMAKYWRGLPHQEAAISKAITDLPIATRADLFKMVIASLSSQQLGDITSLWRAQSRSPLMCLVASFEGYASKAYLCPAGVWTIGYGRTLGVRRGDTANFDQEIQWLAQELRELSRWVSSQYPAIKEEHQVSALVSFVFNIGKGAMSRSTMSRHLLAGRIQDVPAEFGKWIYGSTKNLPLPGLVHRREVEASLFAFGWELRKVKDQVEIGRRLFAMNQ